jgi:hypothetical protein
MQDHVFLVLSCSCERIHKGFMLVRAPLSEVIALCPVVCYSSLRYYKEWSYALECFAIELGLDLVPPPEG